MHGGAKCHEGRRASNSLAAASCSPRPTGKDGGGQRAVRPRRCTKSQGHRAVLPEQIRLPFAVSKLFDPEVKRAQPIREPDQTVSYLYLRPWSKGFASSRDLSLHDEEWDASLCSKLSPSNTSRRG